MVTAPEYQKSLQERRQQLVQVQKQVQDQVQSQSLQFSQRQLRGVPRIERQKAVQKFGEGKAQALGKVKEQFTEEFVKQEQLEKELTPKLAEYEAYKAAEKKAADYKQGYQMGLNKVFPMFTSDVMKEGYKDALSSLKSSRYNEDVIKFKKEVAKVEEEFADQNLKIIYDPSTYEYQGYSVDTPGKQVASPGSTPTFVAPENWKERLVAKVAQFPGWVMEKIVDPTVKSGEFVLKKIPEIPITPKINIIPGVSYAPLGQTKLGDIPMAMPTKEGVQVAGAVLLDQLPIIKNILKRDPKLNPTKIDRSWAAVTLEATKDKPKVELTNVFGGAERIQSAMEFVGKTAGEGWGDIIKKTGLDKVKVPIYVPSSMFLKSQISPPSLLPKFTKLGEVKPFTILPSVAKASPEIIGYLSTGVVPMATLSVAAESERIRTVDTRVQKELEKQYREGINDLVIPEGSRAPTFEEYKIEAEPIIKESLIRQSAIKGTISLAFLAGAGVVAGYKSLTKPIYSKPFTPKFGAKKGIIEIQYVKSGKASYKMYQYKPPKIVTTTSRIRKIFGMGPKEIRIVSKAQLYVQEPFAKTLVSLKQGKSYIAQVGKVKGIPKWGFRGGKDLLKKIVYGKTGKLQIIKTAGIGKQVSPEAFAKLTKQEKYILKALYNKPIVAIKPGQLNVGKTISIGSKPPKLVYTFTDIKKLPTGKLGWYKGSAPPTFAKTETVFKDITKGMYRASGKIDKWKGIIIKSYSKAPDQSLVLKLYTSTSKAKNIRGGVLPLKAYQIPLKATKFVSSIKNAPKKIFSELLGRSKKGGITFSTFGSSQTLAPPLLKTIPKAVFTIPKQVTTITQTVIEPKQIERFVGLASLWQGETSKTNLSLIEVPKQDEAQEDVVEEIPKVDFAPKVVTGTKSIQIPKQEVIPKITPLVIQTPVISKPVVSVIPQTTTPKTPKPKSEIRIIPQPEKKPRKKVSLRKRKKRSLFTPYVKRYKKWKPVSKPVSKKEAIEIGVKKLKTTLAASLMIKTGGKAIPFTKPKKPKEFRLSKEGLILIQKAPRRLKARTEVSEIIKTRGRRPLKFL